MVGAGSVELAQEGVGREGAVVMAGEDGTLGRVEVWERVIACLCCNRQRRVGAGEMGGMQRTEWGVGGARERGTDQVEIGG